MLFSGLYTALVTPFKNDKIDEKALEKMIEFQIKNGVDGIVPCGTTGESPTLTHDEHNLVIDLSIKISNKRIKVIAGTGSNSTAEAIMMTNHAKKSGADGCLIVTPYYNKPTQEGLYQHFKAINDQCEIPLILYNIPGRSVINMTDETIAKLAKLKNIVGLKDATGDLARVASLRLLVDENFSILSGEDATAVGFNAMGGYGVISVTSNIAPRLCADLQKFTKTGDYKSALQVQDKLTDLHSAMFCETNPGPVKYAASLMGLCSSEIRLPLTLPSDANKARVEKEMKRVGLI
ncbi:MAG: dihydrodipicolinate synthase [Rickettsiaceae bacterium]|jgi:4-hydroxy-tetrahydrodipicolinate synthase|nr:dihydrodipicolinate synthase [Rickettsiaceae bacterium]